MKKITKIHVPAFTIEVEIDSPEEAKIQQQTLPLTEKQPEMQKEKMTEKQYWYLKHHCDYSEDELANMDLMEARKIIGIIHSGGPNPRPKVTYQEAPQKKEESNFTYPAPHEPYPWDQSQNMCTIEGCNRLARSRKMCHMHYQRWAKARKLAN